MYTVEVRLSFNLKIDNSFVYNEHIGPQSIHGVTNFRGSGKKCVVSRVFHQNSLYLEHKPTKVVTMRFKGICKSTH